MKRIALIACAAVTSLIAACTLVPALAPPDWPEPPVAVVDTCDNPQEVIVPHFVVGYMEITEPLITDPEYIIGAQSFILYQEVIDSLDEYLDAALEAEWPQYDFDVYVNQSDYRIAAFVVHGTNDRHQFYGKMLVRYNGLRHYFGFATQYFVFGGALTAQQYKEVAQALPSVDMFNFRGTEYDSAEYDQIARVILGECKAGRYWADFRWGGPWALGLPEAFQDAGWGVVTQGAVSDEPWGSAITLSFSDAPAAFMEVLELFEAGHQVITYESPLEALPGGGLKVPKK